MTTSVFATHLRREELRARTDAELLRRYVATSEEATFAELMQRHGPMVLRLCRRFANSEADDAFQAVFVLLARKAATIRQPEALASWLYGVAFRIARKAGRQRRATPNSVRRSVVEPIEELSARELLDRLDDELTKLSDNERLPLLLVYWQGRTYADAARELGLSVPALHGRLERGRKRLANRLRARGIGPHDLQSLLLVPLTNPLVANATNTHTMAVAAKGATIPAAVAALAAGSGSTKLVTVGLFAAVLVSAGLCGALGAKASQTKDDTSKAEAKAPPKILADAPQDSLPAGAFVRFGSQRLRHVGMSDFAALPNGESVTTTGRDGALRTWSLLDGRLEQLVLLERAEGERGLHSISDNGRVYAESRPDRTTIWDTKTGKIKKTLPGLQKQLSFLWLSPDGETLALGTSYPAAVTLLEWQSGQRQTLELPPLRHGPATSYHGRWSPDGKRFSAGGGINESLSVFDVAKGEVIQRFDCNAMNSVFSADSKYLIVAAFQGQPGEREQVVKKFDLEDGKELLSYPMGHDKSFYSMSISPDGNKLACGWSDEACILDMKTGKVTHQLKDKPMAVEFSRDGSKVICRGIERLHLIDAETGKSKLESWRDFGPLAKVALSPDGKWLAATDSFPSSVGLWELATGRFVRELPFGRDRIDLLMSMNFADEGHILTVAGRGGWLVGWNTDNWTERWRHQMPPLDANDSGWQLCQFQTSVDGHRAAALTFVHDREKEKTRVRLVGWRLPEKSLIREEILAETPPYPHSVWLADVARVAVVIGGNIEVIDVQTGVRRLRMPTVPGMTGLTASPDERLLAARRTQAIAGSEVSDLVIWELASGMIAKTIGTGPVDLWQISADGRKVVTTDQLHLKVWELTTGRELLRHALPQVGSSDKNRGPASTLILTSDGGRAYTGLADGTGLLWDLGPPLDALTTSESAMRADWADLARQAEQAVPAIVRLSAAPPGDVVRFMRQHLRPTTDAIGEQIQKAIRDLDSDDFKTRDQATKALEGFGTAAVPALQDAAGNTNSPEVRRRVDSLLTRAQAPAVSYGDLRSLRAIQVLERLNSDNARDLLANLATGVAYVQQTQEAKAALARLESRKRK